VFYSVEMVDEEIASMV